MMQPRVALIALVLPIAITAASDNHSIENFPSEGVRVERKAVPGGAQLLTLFAPAPFDLSDEYAEGIPVLSYLKDTLGDASPENDRIRQVWTLTAAKRSKFRRALDALPVVSFGYDHGSVTSGMPAAAVDLGNPARGTWSSIVRVLIQGQILDPTGMALRTSSRAYEWNSQSHDDLNVYEAIALLARLDDAGLPPDVAEDVKSMHARLLLSRRILGGLVRDRRLEHVFESDETNRGLARAHNWELIRQQAEANGLYFEPISFGDPEATHAMLWARRSDISRAGRAFDPGLLNIASPWGDERLIAWKGYTETWNFDAGGARTDEPASETDQVIPIALYSLEYPRVPLLIVDFRSSGAPHRREVAARIAQNVTRGVLGFSPVANWNFFVGKWAWDFVARRHGAANDRPARLRMFAETSYLLSMDLSVRGPLRAELKRRVQSASPMMSRRARVAALQYAALAHVDKAGGLNAMLQRDRDAELTSYNHGPLARFGLSLAHIGTFGAYRHAERESSPIEALDANRRVAHHKRILEAALQNEASLDAPWSAAGIRASVGELAEASLHTRKDPEAAGLVKRVLARSHDQDVREACVTALQQLRRTDVPAVVMAGSGKSNCAACRGSVAAASPVTTTPLSGPAILGATH